MRKLLRPRVLIALLVGTAAALLAWMLPPRPDWSAQLPMPEDAKPEERVFTICGVSSNARYLVTYGHGAPQKWAYHVWDRERGLDKSIIADRMLDKATHLHFAFSPDESQLAIVMNANVFLYELESARLVNEWMVTGDRVTFSPEGRLVYVAERVVRDLESGQELRRLPEKIDGYEHMEQSFEHHFEDFAIYRKGRLRDKDVRLYSWHTGQLVAQYDLIGNNMNVHSISRDGLVIAAHGHRPGTTYWTVPDFNILLDASGTMREGPKDAWARQLVLSPDGDYVARFGPLRRPKWMPKWWPTRGADQAVTLLHWRSDNELAMIPHAEEALFSPQGNQLALLREGGVIDVYAFPFRTPWGFISGAALFAGGGAWSIGWLWTRWRARGASTAAKPALGTPPG